MATTNDNAVVDLGRLKTFKSKLDASMEASANIETTPERNMDGYSPAKTTSNYGVAIGNNASAHSDGCVSLGIDAASETEGATALGSKSRAIGRNCLAAGSQSVAKGDECTAAGNNAIAFGQGGNTAIGASATIESASGSEAIGATSKVVGEVSLAIALGSGSEANDSKTLSIGNESVQRRIVNVDKPLNPTDAATKKYVDDKTMYVIDIVNKTEIKKAQLDEIKVRWPYVAVYNGSAICQGVRENVNINNGKTTSFSFIYANRSNSLVGDSVIVGPSAAVTEALFVDQINIDATTGKITHNTGRSLFPIIATNPSFSGTGSVKAIGNQTVAIGNNSAATGPSSTAIGDSSKAAQNAATAIGSSSVAQAIGSIAIGSNARALHAQSTALGMGSLADRENQVSIGNKASSVVRFLSNVKDPVEDQDAATRYWVKNADRSDVFANNTSINTYGGSGMFDLEANRDLKWVSVSGYTSWSTFATAWSKMVNLPGGNSSEWWIKTDLKVPDAMKPSKSFVSSHPCGLEFFSTYTMPERTFSVLVAVGSDGYIYIGKWTSKPPYGDEPYGIYLNGHRFYL